jgi:hypothetical protein
MFLACSLDFLTLLLAPPPPALWESLAYAVSVTREHLRELNIDFPRRGLAIVEVGMMIGLKTRLHPIEAIEFQEGEAFGFASTLVHAQTDSAWLHLCKVLRDRVHGGREGKIT